jgi:hypothetical protein
MYFGELEVEEEAQLQGFDNVENGGVPGILSL